MDDGIWQAALGLGQRQLGHGHDDFMGEDIGGLDAGSPTRESHGMTALLSEQQSMSDLMSIENIVRDAGNDHQTLLLGQSLPSPGYFTTTKTHPADQQPASFHSTIPNINFHNISDKLSPSSPPQLIDDWSPSSAQVSTGRDLFFANISHFVPFLHRATFDISQTAPHLLFSVLSLAYQYGENPDCEEQPGSGASLSLRRFHRARALLFFGEDDLDESMPYLTMVQAYLLLQICSMMYLCGKDSAYGLKMHSKMISHARTGGLMQATPDDAGSAGDLESLWRHFIKMESLKRTVFAVHQIDALCPSKNTVYPLILMCLSISIVMYIIPMSTTNVGARYFPMMILPFASVGPQLLLYKTINLHLARPVSKRAAASALVNALGGTSNIWASYLYYAPPHFFAAFGTLMACANARLDSGDSELIAKVMKGGVTREMVEMDWRYEVY
ncbi:hypothetical protein LQW54_001340 [Pestalotiopsis sp. IQ-011]